MKSINISIIKPELVNLPAHQSDYPTSNCENEN